MELFLKNARTKSSGSCRCGQVKAPRAAFTKCFYNSSTIFLLFYTIIPRAHFLAFPREILVSLSKENPSSNLACTKFFNNSSTKLPYNLCFLLGSTASGEELWKNCKKIFRVLVRQRGGEEL
jgi:hypothetical protein